VKLPELNEKEKSLLANYELAIYERLQKLEKEHAHGKEDEHAP
jgi:hypothetical protein